MIIQNMQVIFSDRKEIHNCRKLQTTDFLFLCRSSLLLSEICQNIHMKFDAQIAANGVSGSIYFKNFMGGMPQTLLARLMPSALVCMTNHTTLASPLHTAQPFFPIPPINTTFTSTFPLLVQQETGNSSEQGIQSSQPAFRPQSNGRPDPNPGSFEVTLLHLCDPRVQKCHGCGQPIRSPGMMIPLPGDIIVVTKMR